MEDEEEEPEVVDNGDADGGIGCIDGRGGPAPGTPGAAYSTQPKPASWKSALLRVKEEQPEPPVHTEDERDKRLDSELAARAAQAVEPAQLV